MICLANDISQKYDGDNNTIFIGWYDDQDSMMNATVEITQGSINLNARSVTVNGDSII